MSLLVFCQREWEKSPWLPTTYPATDAELSACGFKLAGWVRDTSALTEEERARVWSLAGHALSSEQEAELKLLLERCPFTSHRLPFLDVDVAKKLEPDRAERARELASDYARALDAVTEAHGLGRPAWAISNTRGGLHGRLGPPEKLVTDPLLPEALARLVRQAARSAKVPLLSEIPPKTEDRFASGVDVFLDDRYFVASVESRGRQWRLERIPKPGGIYFPTELPLTGSTIPVGDRWTARASTEADALEKGAASFRAEEVEAQLERDGEAAKRRFAMARLEELDPPRAAKLGGWDPKWVARAREGILADVAQAPGGQRNETLNLNAFRAGTLVAGGAFHESIRDEIEAAALTDPEANPPKIRDTLRRGFEAGLRSPATPKPRVEDLERAVEDATEPKKKLRNDGPPASRIPLGPLGRALYAAEFLEKDEDGCCVQKNEDALVAKCPRGHKGAVFFPDSDRWWCGTCRDRPEPYELLLKLPEGAREKAWAAYDRALEKGKGNWKLNVTIAPETPALRAWVSTWAPSEPGAGPRAKVLEALAGSIKKLKFADDLAISATVGVEDMRKAQDRVRRINLRLRRADQQKFVAGSPSLLRTLGPRAVFHLAKALHEDAGNNPVELATVLLGRRSVSNDKPQCEWLTIVHDGLPQDDPIRAHVLRSTKCAKLGDKVCGDGKFLGYQWLVCEDLGCGACFLRRIEFEARSVADSWKGKGPFYLYKIEGIPDEKTYKKLRDQIKRTVPYAKVTVVTARDGKLGLLVVTTDEQARAALGPYSGWASRIPGMTFSEIKASDHNEAVAQVALARVALHVHELEIRKKRDAAEFVAWKRFAKGKHFVTRSRTALPWPSRETVRALASAEKEDKIDLSGADEVTYTLVDRDTKTEIHEQNYPHTIYEAALLARSSTKLRRAEESTARDPEAAKVGDELEIMLLEELRREALALPVPI